MIISKTPYRISFFGGGTDYPQWYLNEGGKVLSTSIDKYCVISCRQFLPFFNYRHRIVWSYIELVNTYKDILHPAVRSILKHLEIEDKFGLEIHHQGDLPARSGIGSSSSFAVGLLHALYTLKNKRMSQLDLALEAINLEQKIMKESVGSQDQVAVAVGGLNQLHFQPDGQIVVNSLDLAPGRQEELESNFMLFFIGSSRSSSEMASQIIENISRRENILRRMRLYVDEAVELLQSENDLDEFGELLHKNWLLKKELSPLVSNSTIDRIYDLALKNGAIGGKLLGAGGTGFMLFYVPVEKQEDVKHAMIPYIHVPFKFENEGTTVMMRQAFAPSFH